MVPRLPILAEPPYRLAQPHGQTGNRLQSLLAALGKPAIVLAPYFRQQQFRIAQDSSQRIIQFVAESLTETFAAQRSRLSGQTLRVARRFPSLTQPALQQAQG
jgi:hypothetical protein